MTLLTNTADYDTPGSWGHASNGWPEFPGEDAYNMYVFANCVQSIPYGSYVLMTDTLLRVHPTYTRQLRKDFEDAGKPTSKESVSRRETTGETNSLTGNKYKAPKWW